MSATFQAAALRRATLLPSRSLSRSSTRHLQTFSRFHSPSPSTSSASPSTSSTFRLPRRTAAGLGSSSIGASRSFSLWPKGSSPAPIVGEDGKLVQPSSASEAVASTSSSPTVASSSTTATPVDFQPTPPAPSSPLLSTSEAASSTPSTFTAELASATEETRRTLAEYGLGGGGIVGRVQELLEWTHLTTGLPWYLTIATVVVGIRLALFPIMIKVMGNNARLAHIQPRLMANIQKLKRAQSEKRMTEVAALQMETKKLMTDNNCHPIKGLILPLVQMPLFITFFFALRGMSNAGLPDFATGGLAWFENLSIPDPYYVLPVLSAGATLAVLQVGEFGQPEQTGIAKGIRSGIKLLIPLIVWATSTFPAGVLVYWVTHNSFSVLQALVLRIPAFKRAMNIPDPPERPKKADGTVQDPVGFMQAFRDTRDAFKEQVEEAKERTEASQRAKEEKKAEEQRHKGKVYKSLRPKEAAVQELEVLDEAVDPAVEEKKRRVEEARKRREAQRTRKSRI